MFIKFGMLTFGSVQPSIFWVSIHSSPTSKHTFLLH